MSTEVFQLDSFGRFHDLTPYIEVGLYPGGEPWVKLSLETPLFGGAPVLVRSRIRSVVELAYFHDIVKALQLAGVQNLHAFLPYLPAARSDRPVRDEVIMPMGLEFYATVLNSLHLRAVYTLDVHSEISLDTVDRLVTINSTPAVEKIIEQQRLTVTSIVGPDRGSKSRAGHVANTLGVPLYLCDKKRDPNTGKLVGFKAPKIEVDGFALIVDDICDGGGTFAGILQALRANNPYHIDFGLFVTHGIFSGNFKKNLEDFHKLVWTTDSVRNPEVFKYASIDVFEPIIIKEMTK